jgi:outer membrane protein OmpA-like peptidoglycan-associated protein
MRLRTSSPGVALLLAAAVVAPPFLAGCGGLAERSTPSAQAAHRSPLRALAVAQVRSDDDSRFELCPLDACPRPTPKTVGNRAQALAPTMPAADPPPAMTTNSGATAGTPLVGVSAIPVQQLAEPAPAVPAPSRTILVTFAPGASHLTTAAQQTLADILPEARRARVIEIRGRTDERGSVAFNDVLARNRALAVRDYLTAHNLATPTTVRLSSRGACCYVAGNDTAEGRAANRRVEIEWQPALQIAQRTTHERF